MCLRFVFLLIVRVAAWLQLSRRGKAWKTAEILILRHQLAVLQRRQPRRLQLNWAERADLAAIPALSGRGDPGVRLLLGSDQMSSAGFSSGVYAGSRQAPATPHSRWRT